MIDATIRAHDSLDATVRQFVFELAAATGAVPQSNEIARPSFRTMVSEKIGNIRLSKFRKPLIRPS